ncbi:hypothetical protein R9C00_25710 [Flammeovirgaceae bacterium SG7u.111]|nr:hypothetical protein [Flammeovirgaceae bacterium SG7u.132]WPO35095.1 hypothetical protein R9C00_25710 [Flammeovirgaceae bacterium SG7u.111]
MEIETLKTRTSIDQNDKLFKIYTQFEEVLAALRKKELPEQTIGVINQEIQLVNSIPESGKELKKQIKKGQGRIVKLLEKELKIVPQSYYQSTWMGLGMAAFGLPMGVAFGMALGNLAFLSIGLPIGMAIGLAVGSGMDKKALEEGRQLDVKIKFYG